jgi:hypothetical protein
MRPEVDQLVMPNAWLLASCSNRHNVIPTPSLTCGGWLGEFEKVIGMTS